jgi:hypothetical protein
VLLGARKRLLLLEQALAVKACAANPVTMTLFLVDAMDDTLFSSSGSKIVVCDYI